MKIYLNDCDSKNVVKIQECLEEFSLYNCDFSNTPYKVIINSDFTYVDECDEMLGTVVLDRIHGLLMEV
jgi:hypothetical protein